MLLLLLSLCFLHDELSIRNILKVKKKKKKGSGKAEPIGEVNGVIIYDTEKKKKKAFLLPLLLPPNDSDN